jgi:predicted enzyme related to lactoylglutathione lyase
VPPSRSPSRAGDPGGEGRGEVRRDGNVPAGNQTLDQVIGDIRTVFAADQMRHAGARITKAPVDAEFFAGRSAYLCDPEGNYFEIAWAEPSNPILAAARRVAGS